MIDTIIKTTEKVLRVIIAVGGISFVGFNLYRAIRHENLFVGIAMVVLLVLFLGLLNTREEK